MTEYEHHYNYEIGMLQHTYEKVINMTEGADWNVYFESFCVHAYNLAMSYREKTPDNIQDILERIEEQVFTLSDKRTTIKENKVHTERITELYDWLVIELNL